MNALAAAMLMQVTIQVAPPQRDAVEPPPAPAHVIVAPQSHRPDFFVEADGGVGRGTLFGRAMAGPAGGVAVGLSIPTRFGAVEGVGDGEYDALETNHGIGIHRFALGATGGIHVWHVHLGAGLDLGSTWIARVSGSTESAHELFVGFHGVATLDLFTVAGLTPFIQGRAAANTVMPTLAGSAGLRFQF